MAINIQGPVTGRNVTIAGRDANIGVAGVDAGGRVDDRGKPPGGQSASSHGSGATAPTSTSPSPEPPAPFNVFISYRRNDSEDVTGRIRDRLREKLGPSAVFMDVHNLPLGVDFRRAIASAVQQCAVMLVVIGRHWLDSREGEEVPRIHEELDLVRLEVSSALARETPVIPVLVQSATTPNEHDLPGDVRDLAYRNGISVRAGRDFDGDMDHLISALHALRTSLSANEARDEESPHRVR